MESKVENIIYKTYVGGAEELEKEDMEDTSTVDTDTSEIMKRLDADDDEDGSIDIDSDAEEEDANNAPNADEESDVDSNEDIDSDDEEIFSSNKVSKKKTLTAATVQNPISSDIEEDDEDEDEDDEDYLQKLDESVRHNIIGDYHPEMIQHNDEEVETLCKIVKDADGVIIDPFHKTLPFVTKYEKARILGERAKQINSGAKPFIKVDKHIIDGYLIALREFEEKKIPFIIRRPLPNGGSEYWKLADLQILD